MKDLIVGVIVVLLIILAFICGINSKEKCYDGSYYIHTIVRGETIWNVASGIEGNTEKIVYTIRKDNKIDDCGNLKIGQQIILREDY